VVISSIEILFNSSQAKDYINTNVVIRYVARHSGAIISTYAIVLINADIIIIIAQKRAMHLSDWRG